MTHQISCKPETQSVREGVAPSRSVRAASDSAGRWLLRRRSPSCANFPAAATMLPISDLSIPPINVDTGCWQADGAGRAG